MALKNSSTEFGSLAKALHWLIAVGIFVLIWLGLEQAGMERGDAKLAVRAQHASVALVVFVLMTVRITWRFINVVPGHPQGTPLWQQLSARIVHWGLYLAVFGQLIAGMLTVATGGRPLPFFGLFSVPLPIVEDEESHHFWEEIHESLWILLAVLLVVHVFAAIYNHSVVKNDVLRRMTVGLSGDS